MPLSPAPGPASPSDPRLWPAIKERQLRQWQRTYLWVGPLIAALLPVGLYNGWTAGTVAWHLSWAASMLLGALSMRVFRGRFGLATAYVIDLFSGVAAAMVVAPTGPQGAPFGILMALPLGVMALAPSTPALAGLVGVGALAGGLTLIVHSGAGLKFGVTWVSVELGFTLLAVMGAVAFRRIWLSELRAQRDNAEMHQALAAGAREREQLERRAATARLAAALGHEINNPLAVVRANLDYVLAARASGEPEPADASSVFADISACVDRIARSVGQMRRLSLSATPPPEALRLEGVVADARRSVELLLSGVRVSEELPPELPAVLGVRSMLSAAVEALLLNAAEAALAAPEPGRWVALQARAAGCAIVLTVDDGGAGLSEEARAHLFEPFFTTKGPQRSGLGLAVAREQVVRCGGALSGCNRADGGARFTVELQAMAPGGDPAAA